MTGGWTQITDFEDAATAGSSAINAAVFFERSLRARGPRRTAALLLASLFAGVVAAAALRLAAAEPSALAAVLRGPLLAACVAVTSVLVMGARR